MCSPIWGMIRVPNPHAPAVLSKFDEKINRRTRAKCTIADVIIEQALIYIVATSLKQTMESYDNIYNSLTKNIYDSEADARADGWRILNNNMEHSISHTDLGGGSLKIVALPSNPDSQVSFNSNIQICDELHAYNLIKIEKY